MTFAGFYIAELKILCDTMTDADSVSFFPVNEFSIYCFNEKEAMFSKQTSLLSVNVKNYTSSI